MHNSFLIRQKLAGDMASINCISWREVVLWRLTEITEIWTQIEVRLLNYKFSKRYYFSQRCDVKYKNFLNCKNIKAKLWKLCLLPSIRKKNFLRLIDNKFEKEVRKGEIHLGSELESWLVLFIFPRNQENKRGSPRAKYRLITTCHSSQPGESSEQLAMVSWRHCVHCAWQ